MLEMIAVAGDFVAGAVWHRIIQIVTNHKDLQVIAATGYDEPLPVGAGCCFCFLHKSFGVSSSTPMFPPNYRMMPSSVSESC